MARDRGGRCRIRQHRHGWNCWPTNSSGHQETIRDLICWPADCLPLVAFFVSSSEPSWALLCHLKVTLCFSDCLTVLSFSFLRPSIHLFLPACSQSTHTTTYFIHPSIHLPKIHASIHSSTPIHPYICTFNSFATYNSVRLYVCMPILPFWLPTCLPVFLNLV